MLIKKKIEFYDEVLNDKNPESQKCMNYLMEWEHFKELLGGIAYKNNKTALITGCTSGIGEILSVKFAQKGYNLIIEIYFCITTIYCSVSGWRLTFSVASYGR